MGEEKNTIRIYLNLKLVLNNEVIIIKIHPLPKKKEMIRNTKKFAEQFN